MAYTIEEQKLIGGEKSRPATIADVYNILADSPTITTPTIADFTNAQHDHEDAAGGGVLAPLAITTPVLGRVFASTLQSKTTATYEDIDSMTITFNPTTQCDVVVHFGMVTYSNAARGLAKGIRAYRDGVVAGVHFILQGHELASYYDYLSGTVMIQNVPAGSTTITLRWYVYGDTQYITYREMWIEQLGIS